MIFTKSKVGETLEYKIDDDVKLMVSKILNFRDQDSWLYWFVVRTKKNDNEERIDSFAIFWLDTLSLTARDPKTITKEEVSLYLLKEMI